MPVCKIKRAGGAALWQSVVAHLFHKETQVFLVMFFVGGIRMCVKPDGVSADFCLEQFLKFLVGFGIKRMLPYPFIQPVVGITPLICRGKRFTVFLVRKYAMRLPVADKSVTRARIAQTKRSLVSI